MTLGRGLPRGAQVPVALGLVLIASPFMLMAAAAILLESGGPVFLRQTRTGQDGRPLTVTRFRAMR